MTDTRAFGRHVEAEEILGVVDTDGERRVEPGIFEVAVAGSTATCDAARRCDYGGRR
jgi:hypothetical protein